MRTAVFLVAALATANLGAAGAREEDQIEVSLSVYFDQSGESEPHVMKIGREPKTFTFKIEDVEQLSLKMTLLDGCRVSIEILRRDNVTGTRPLSWPAFFEPGTTFTIGVHFPRHRQEVRGAVSGTGACSSTALGSRREIHTWKHLPSLALCSASSRLGSQTRRKLRLPR
jgi:hypothetical protein